MAQHLEVESMSSELIEYFVRHYSLVIDNEEGSYNEARRVTGEAILEESPDLTREAYAAMSDHERMTEFAQGIGANILALIEEWTDQVLDEASGDFGQALIRGVLITNGSDMAWELGRQYMPESNDVDFLPEQDDEDETDDMQAEQAVRY